MANNYKFEPENVQTDMMTLEGYFTDFADTLKKLNDYIETIINAGADSAILGLYGAKLFEIWDANAATFGDFHANFSAWSEAVAVISANNTNFEVNTISAYLNSNCATAIDSFVDKGSTLDGVADARAFVSEYGRDGDTSNLSDDAKAVMGNASDTQAGLVKNGYYIITETIENGQKVIIKTSATNENDVIKEYYDGDKIVESHQYNGDELVSKTIYYEDGNYSVSIYSTNGNVTTTLFDSYDNEIETSISCTTAQGFMETYGVADGSLKWQEAFNALPQEEQAIMLAENAGKYNLAEEYDVNNYGITDVVPTDGVYDGRNVVLPTSRANEYGSWNATDAEEVGNIMIDSGTAVKENLDGEASALTTLSTNLETNSTFQNLSSENQKVISDYLTEQINYRQEVSAQIEEDCNYGVFVSDGSVGNMASAVPMGSWELIYQEAASAVEEWDKGLTNIDNLNEVTAYLNSYGVFF